jgi:nitrogen fixation NifU-like protein
MSDALYQKAIVELARDASAAGAMANPDASVTRDNPLCGDRVTLQARFAPDGSIAELKHTTRGCLLCQASAAMVGHHAAGLSAQKAAAAEELARGFLKGAAPGSDAWPELDYFIPVRGHKSRHDCVILAFDALAALFKR